MFNGLLKVYSLDGLVFNQLDIFFRFTVTYLTAKVSLVQSSTFICRLLKVKRGPQSRRSVSWGATTRKMAERKWTLVPRSPLSKGRLVVNWLPRKQFLSRLLISLPNVIVFGINFQFCYRSKVLNFGSFQKRIISEYFQKWKLEKSDLLSSGISLL